MNEQQVFLNRQVELSRLPQVGQVHYHPLQKSYQHLRLLTTVLTLVVMMVASGVVLSVTEVPGWVPFAGVGFWLLILMVSLLFIIKGFPHMGYAVRERDRLYKRQTTIPFTRIQHVDVRQGVLERSYDLGKLNIYTAGGQGSDLSIPGLRFDEAQRLKAFILGKVTEDEEE